MHRSQVLDSTSQCMLCIAPGSLGGQKESGIKFRVALEPPSVLTLVGLMRVSLYTRISALGARHLGVRQHIIDILDATWSLEGEWQYEIPTAVLE